MEGFAIELVKCSFEKGTDGGFCVGLDGLHVELDIWDAVLGT